MPIRLNLLAEVQAAEEVRRRDPVKRVIWVAVLLVCLMLAWWSWLLVKATLARNVIGGVEQTIATHTNEYQMVIDNQKKVVETARKLTALQQLATNRFLNGNLLNALQQTSIDGIRIMHMKVEQTYSVIEAPKPKDEKAVPLPSKIAEHIVLSLDARDASANPGGSAMRQFMETIASNDYFKNAMGATNVVRLTKYSPPQAIPGEAPFVLFTLQCAYPEKIR